MFKKYEQPQRIFKNYTDLTKRKTHMNPLRVYRNSTRLTGYLDKIESGKILIIFDHGMGDYVLFLNIFQKLIETYPHLDLYLGYHEKFELGPLHPKMYKLPINPGLSRPLTHNELYSQRLTPNKYDMPKLAKEFEIVSIIVYPEPSRNRPINKMLLCNEFEIGLDECPRAGYNKLYDGDVVDVNDSNIIGIHAVANSGVNAKSIDSNQLVTIWGALEDMGYKPYLFHPSFGGSNPQNRSYNIRHINPSHIIDTDLNGLMTEIAKCKFFISIVSGLGCLSHAILGDDRNLSISKLTNISAYILGTNMNSLHVNNISKNNIKNSINILEGNIQ